MRKVDEKERDMELFTIRENRVETQIRGKKEKNEGRKGKINRTTVERFGCFRKKEKKRKVSYSSSGVHKITKERVF